MANAFLIKYKESGKGIPIKNEEVFFTSSSYQTKEQCSQYMLQQNLNLDTFTIDFSFSFSVSSLTNAVRAISFGAAKTTENIALNFFNESNNIACSVGLQNSSKSTVFYYIYEKQGVKMYFKKDVIYHVDFVYKNSKMYIYINGQQVLLGPSGTGSGYEEIQEDGGILFNKEQNICYFMLKNCASNEARILPGSIYELNLYKIALTQEDIDFNYNRAKELYS